QRHSPLRGFTRSSGRAAQGTMWPATSSNSSGNLPEGKRGHSKFPATCLPMLSLLKNSAPMKLQEFRSRAEFLRRVDFPATVDNEHLLDDLLGQTILETSADSQGKIALDGNQATVKGAVVQRAEAQPVAWVDMLVLLECCCH